MRIAVVIASRNRANTLPETLRSIQAQTRPADEIWVVDDASTDGTQELLRSTWMGTPGFHSEKIEHRVGPGGARNHVLSKVQSDWILPLDADDRLLPAALQLFEAKAKNTNADLLYGNIIEVKSDNRTNVNYPQIPDGMDGVRFILGRPRIPFKHSACLFKLSTLRALGGYDESLMLKVDVDLVLRLIASGKTTEALHDTVLEHFLHPTQMSRRRLRGMLSYSMIMDKRGLSEHLSKFDRGKYLALRTLWEMGKAIRGR